MSEQPRFCREARSQLPSLVAGDLTGWPERVVQSHLHHCEECAAEFARQKTVANSLTAMREQPPSPPAGLLDELLARADTATRRERAAVPVRGAVSGARPGLSIAFLTVGAAASTGLGYGVVRALRALRRR